MVVAFDQFEMKKTSTLHQRYQLVGKMGRKGLRAEHARFAEKSGLTCGGKMYYDSSESRDSMELKRKETSI